MTCIIKKLFHATATRNNKAVRIAAHDIVERSNEFAAILASADGTDATREALTAAGFGWLYDSLGKPNAKGKSKKIMSPLSRKIKEGMSWLSDGGKYVEVDDELIFKMGENADVFLWEASHDNPTASLHDFPNIKAALAKAILQASPKVIADDTSEGEGEGEGENATDDKPQTIDEMAKAIIEKLGRKDADKLSVAIADLLNEGEGADKKAA